MIITCAHDVIGMDELNALLTEENLAVFNLTNPVEGYVLTPECGIKNTLVAQSQRFAFIRLG